MTYTVSQLTDYSAAALDRAETDAKSAFEQEVGVGNEHGHFRLLDGAAARSVRWLGREEWDCATDK